MDTSIRPLKKGEIPQCSVCYKTTRNECSHVSCPNRKRITAQIPQGEGILTAGGGVFSNPLYGRYQE